MKTPRQEIEALLEEAHADRKAAANALDIFDQRIEALTRVLELGDEVCANVVASIKKEAPGVLPS